MLVNLIFSLVYSNVVIGVYVHVFIGVFQKRKKEGRSVFSSSFDICISTSNVSTYEHNTSYVQQRQSKNQLF